MSVTSFEVVEVGVHALHGGYDHRDTERYTLRSESESGRKRTYIVLVSAREVQL
jgi:hypothetical protein